MQETFTYKQIPLLNKVDGDCDYFTAQCFVTSLLDVKVMK